jgi:hypothetical protein
VCRARVAGAWRRTRLAISLYAPPSPARLSALVPVPDPPPSRSFSSRLVARTPPWRANPIPSFLLFPTRTSPESAPWRCCSPPRVPLVIPLHAASVFGALRHHLRPPGYKCHLVCLSSIPLGSEVEHLGSVFSVSAQVGEAQKLSGRISWGTELRDPVVLADLGFPAKKFKFTSG